MNKHKDFDNKRIWFSPGEYQELVHALDTNDKERVLDIMFAIHTRNDL